ncbi:arginine--tRNA ligase [Sporohalobacter salinus]|uniref:arginine--tRNA ligase n=1 Tax=Sporohalobacter salinus TaxID=1494606 RepID=UPI00195FD65C|nr:arginine--tRNA ligase [Sporohalobacter salinus]MBM7622681.1 arginyl-tRNA synthetase [Sporohalobacter salinus]
MSFIFEIERKLKEKLREAIKRSVGLEIEEIPTIKLEDPREEKHGDYATNIAMVLSGKSEKSSRKIATEISNNLENFNYLSKVKVAGPGFINFYLKNDWLYEVLTEIKEKGMDYGRVNVGEGEKVQVEFVSVNPTGPLHVGHGRGAVVGDVLANLLDVAGYEVSKEYLINDAGNQMDMLGRSVAVRYQQLLGKEVSFLEEGYRGSYIEDIAEEIRIKNGDEYLEKANNDEIEYFREYAYDKMLNRIKQTVNEFGISFDNWFSERSLHPEAIEEVVQELKEVEYIYEEDGALWFKSTEFGDDKDRVVIKSDGSPTYFAADIAYHKNKFERGFDKVINIWGADHHSHVDRMKAVVEALGYDTESLSIILVQMVTLFEDGNEVQMSKRAGEFITLQDVIDEVGVDVARYFYIMRDTDSQLDFDLELAKQESTNNPIYYVQYAHARICSLLEKKENENVKLPDIEEIDLTNLQAEEEIDLLNKLASYPKEISKCAKTKEPHHLAQFVYDLASKFHSFYNKCPVILNDKEVMYARLHLVIACKQILKDILENLLGISAPEKM